MNGQPELGGRRVLVVEDDYYIASDAARALEVAGAVIVGPCANEATACAEISAERPDAALVDINLGDGPSFELAAALEREGVPFVFLTGYDQEAIPEAFADIERLQKPVRFRNVVEAVAKLLPPTR